MSFIETSPGKRDLVWNFAELCEINKELIGAPLHEVHRKVFQFEGHIRGLVAEIIKQPNTLSIPSDESGFIDITQLPIAVLVSRQDPKTNRVVVGKVQAYHATTFSIEGVYVDSSENYGHFCWNTQKEPNEDDLIKWCFLPKKINRCKN